MDPQSDWERLERAAYSNYSIPAGEALIILIEKVKELEKKIHDHPFECHYNDLKCDLKNKEQEENEAK